MIHNFDFTSVINYIEFNVVYGSSLTVRFIGHKLHFIDVIHTAQASAIS